MPVMLIIRLVRPTFGHHANLFGIERILVLPIQSCQYFFLVFQSFDSTLNIFGFVI